MTFILLLSSCQKEIKNIPTEEILDDGTVILAENNAVDFYFYYPENFIIDKNAAMISLYINDSEVVESDIKEPGTGENIVYLSKPNLSATVFDLPAGKYETVDEYWRDLGIPSFEKIFQDIKPEADENLTINEISAKKYTFSCSVSDMKYKISNIICIRKHRVYIITYTATENKYETYVNVLNTVAETFKFK